MRVVSVPALCSVTPKAWRRRFPVAIFGRYSFFCSSEPCRRSVPIVYICAWQAPPLAPERLISSRMIAASVTPSPIPPYSSGMSALSQPDLVSASTNSSGYRRSRSSSRQYSSGYCSHISRTLRPISSCCFVRRKSIRFLLRTGRGPDDVLAHHALRHQPVYFLLGSADLPQDLPCIGAQPRWDAARLGSCPVPRNRYPDICVIGYRRVSDRPQYAYC